VKLKRASAAAVLLAIAGASAFAVSLGTTQARSVVPGRPAAASPEVPSSDIDFNGVIEKVSHYIDRRPATGELVTTDARYRLVLGKDGYTLELRKGKTPGFDGGNLSLTTSAVTVGGAESSLTDRLWSSESNVATRELSNGLLERVTARDGEIEWDLVVDRPGAISIKALVDAWGTGHRATTDEGKNVLRWVVGSGRSVDMGQMVVRDAEGRVLFRQLPKLDGRHVLLNVPASALRGAAYPVTVDPILSPVYRVSDPVWVTDGGQENFPTVGWNGTHYLATWVDTENAITRLVGTRLTPAGVVVDPQGIPISAINDGPGISSIASDGSSFFVVWNKSNSDIRGRLVTSSGTTPSPEVDLNTTASASTAPDVVWGGANYLVTFQRANGTDLDVIAARTNSSGALLDGTGLVVGGGPGNQRNPMVASNGLDFLVVWETDLGDSGDVMSATVSNLGAVGSTVPVAAVINAQNRPDVTYNGTQYVVAWEDFRAGSGVADIYAARVATNGSLTDATSVPVDTSAGAQNKASLASNGGETLVVYYGTSFIRSVRLETDAVPVAPPTALVSGISDTSTRMPIAASGSAYLMTYQPSSDALALKLTPTGTMDGGPITLGLGPQEQRSPSIGWNGSTYLVVWEDWRSGVFNIRLFASRVAPDGTILDGTGIPLGTTSTFQPSVASNGTDFLVGYADFTAGGNIVARRVLANGTLPDPSPIVICNCAGDQREPRVASNGSNYLVAWEDSRNSGTHQSDVRAAIVSSAGTVTAGDVPVSAGEAIESGAAVASDGTDYVMLWNDRRSGFYDIFGSRISSGGTVQDPAGIPVAALADDQTLPEVVWAGSNYYLAWADDRLGTNSNVAYGSRVDTSLALLDGTGTALGHSFIASSKLAFDGVNTVFFYFDSFVIKAKRVSPAGTILDPAGITIFGTQVSGLVGEAVSGPLGQVAFAGDSTSPIVTNLRMFNDVHNDNFVDAVGVSGGEGRSSGVNDGATLEGGEPTHAGPGAADSVWYSWTAPANGTASIDTAGSLIDTRLGVYTGSAVNGLSGVASNDDFNGGPTSQVTFPVTSGTVYKIAVSGGGGAEGFYKLHWFIDTVPPETTIDSGPTGATASQSASFTFSSNEAGSTFECSRDGAPFAGCSSGITYNGLAQGPHTFQVRATDPAGNTDLSPASRAWTVDTVAPDTTITSGPTGSVSSTTASFQFNSNESGTFECSLDGAAFSTCSTGQTYFALAQGSHTFQVRARDGAGNLDPSPASRAWTVDTIAPDTTITSTGPSSPTSSTSATFTFTSNEGGATFECSLDGTAFTGCSPGQTYASLGQGSHTFQVRARDAATNIDPTPASRTWTVDSIPPDTTITSGPSGSVNSTSATFQFNSPDGGTSFECSLDGAAFSSCVSGQSYFALSQGSHFFQVRAIDAALNVDPNPASRSWTVDTVAPDTTILTGPSGTVSSNSAQFTFSSNEGGSTFECSLDGGVFIPCSSGQTFAGLSQGQHSLQVRARDAAMNIDPTPASRTWTVDTINPDTFINSGPGGPTASTSATFAFISNEPGASFECSLDGASFSTCMSGQSYSSLSQGSHTFQVRARDAANNLDPTPANRSWTVDTVAPTTTLNSNPPLATSSTSAEFTFSSNEAGSFRCSLDGAAPSFCGSPTQYSSLADGHHTFSVFARDAAGNEDASPATWEWDVDSGPPETTLTVKPPAIGNDLSVEFEFTSSESGTFKCSLDGAVPALCTSPHPEVVAAGDHTFSVFAADTLGNEDPTPEVWQFVVDTSPPSTGFDTTPPTLTSNTGATFEFFSNEAGTSFECGLDGADLAPCTTPLQLADLTDGDHTLLVVATDPAGNPDPTPASYTWEVDTTGPTATLTGLAPFATSKTLKPKWSATDTGAGVESFDLLVRSAPMNGDFGATSTVLTDAIATTTSFTATPGNTYCFQVVATDELGNESTTSDGCSAVMKDDKTMTKKGTWIRKTVTGTYLNTTSTAKTLGATLSMPVKGEQFGVFVTKCSSCGTIKIMLNGTLLKKVSLKSATTKKRQLITTTQTATPRTGTLKIVVASSGKNVIIEGAGAGRLPPP
jgi:hypothetical protein